MIEAYYRSLLKEGEKNIPENVIRTINFFERNSIWFQISRNPKVYSCKDAASHRKRLGVIGIPLKDELKSYFGKFINSHEKQQVAVFHCRADQSFDFKKAEESLGARSSISKLSENDLHKMFGSKYGIVNPFVLDPIFFEEDILHVFDKGILERSSTPYTMMTNAGDLTWGVEFDPAQLLAAIEKTYGETQNLCHPAKGNSGSGILAILTGSPPEAGMDLWTRVNDYIRQYNSSTFGGDFSLPKVIAISDPDLALATELESRWPYVSAAIKKALVESFRKEGVTHLCLAANPMDFLDSRVAKICEQEGIEYISSSTTTKDFLKESKITEFTRLGWGNSSLKDEFNEVPLSPRAEKLLLELHSHVSKYGVSSKSINLLRMIVKNEIQTEVVLIELNEVSRVLKRSGKLAQLNSKTFIDSHDILAKVVSEKIANH